MGRVITLLGDPLVNEDHYAVEALSPGHLLQFDGAHGVTRCDQAGQNVSRVFALEREELGRDYTTVYAVNDVVKTGSFRRGDRLYAWIPSGENIAQDDYLEAGINGFLTLLSSGSRIARALESVHATSGDAHIRVEVV